jgi:hypothetical protein
MQCAGCTASADSQQQAASSSMRLSSSAPGRTALLPSSHTPRPLPWPAPPCRSHGASSPSHLPRAARPAGSCSSLRTCRRSCWPGGGTAREGPAREHTAGGLSCRALRQWEAHACVWLDEGALWPGWMCGRCRGTWLAACLLACLQGQNQNQGQQGGPEQGTCLAC